MPACSGLESGIRRRRTEQRIHKYLAGCFVEHESLGTTDGFRSRLLRALHHEFGYGGASKAGGALDQTLLGSSNPGLQAFALSGGACGPCGCLRWHDPASRQAYGKWPYRSRLQGHDRNWPWRGRSRENVVDIVVGSQGGFANRARRNALHDFVAREVKHRLEDLRAVVRVRLAHNKQDSRAVLDVARRQKLPLEQLHD